MGRLAAWHLPGGPVGPPSRWAATSNVEVGQTIYPVNRINVGRRRERAGQITKRSRKQEGVEQGRGPGTLSSERRALF